MRERRWPAPEHELEPRIPETRAMTGFAHPPYLTVIVPCRNEARSIERCLQSILASDYPADRMEILVVDGTSSDGTPELLDSLILQRAEQGDRRVRRIDNPERITPVALNRALRAARGDVIARVDAHASIAPDYFLNAVRHLRTSGADNVGGPMRTLPRDPGLFAEPIVAALSHRFGVGNSHFRTGASQERWVDTVFGGCWPRVVFSRVGGFNEALERSQDMEFSLRLKAAGGKTLLAPDVRSDYYARSTLGSFWRHNLLNGEWAVLPFLYSRIVPVSLRHLIPLVFVLAILAGMALVPLTPWPMVALACAYGTANLAASMHATYKFRRPSFLMLLPVTFASLHVAYGLGSLWAVLKIPGIQWSRRHACSQPRESHSFF